MQRKSPLDTGFLAPQFAAGRRKDGWPGAAPVLNELEAMSRPPPTQLAVVPSTPAPQVHHAGRPDALPSALQETLKTTLNGAELAPGPKVSVRRSRRIGITQPEQVQQQADGERQGRVFVLKTTGAFRSEPMRDAQSDAVVQRAPPEPAPAAVQESATPVEEAAVVEDDEVTRALLTPLGRRRRRVPDFQKPGAVVVIKPASAAGMPAESDAPKEDDPGPSLNELRQQLAALSLREAPEEFVFDLTHRGRWDAIDSALERLRTMARASPFVAEDAFMPDRRRRKSARS